jgi:hypothetical protein
MPVFSIKTPVYFTGIIVDRFSDNFQNQKQANNADSISQYQTINGWVELQDVSASASVNNGLCLRP